jgi:hydroxypyruvate reductase
LAAKGAYRAALRAVAGDFVMSKVARSMFRHRDFPIKVLAVGKAASAMVAGLSQDRPGIATGLVITTELDNGPRYDGFEYLVSSHPIPDERSLIAGERALEFSASCQPRDRVVLLLSGGASALMESLRPGIGLSDFQFQTRNVMNSGADIFALNEFRQQHSLIKSGGLARALAHVKWKRAYVISDVKGDDFGTIGSGPFWDEEHSIPHRVVANNAMAVTAARAHLLRNKFWIEDDEVPPFVPRDATEFGKHLGLQALALMDKEAVVYGGEPTLSVTGDIPGGRSQHVALVAATKMDWSGTAVLAAGTDGRDGATNYAGACITAQDKPTPERIEEFKTAIRTFDTTRIIEEENWALPAGYTGTNVNDIFIALRA